MKNLQWAIYKLTPTVTISNNSFIQPSGAKQEPNYIKGAGWFGGYSFKHFLGNVYAWLGDLSEVDGMQQLVHHYYLQNGGINARDTAQRIKLFIGETECN